MGSVAALEEVYQIYPSGWQDDPDEERIKLSLFDPIILVTYCQFALYFRLDDDDDDDGDSDSHEQQRKRERIAKVLKLGLAKTLSQVRHFCGTIEKDPEGGFSFVKRRDTSIKYVVKSLEGPAYPSFGDIERASFSCRSLGDLSEYSIAELPYGEGRPESDPNNSPVISGFQLNFVRGGAVLSSHIHHWATDLVGWSNFIRQLADNCRAIHTANADKDATASIQWPPWDPSCIDLSHYTEQLPTSALIDGPPIEARHPGHPEKQQTLLFHVSPSSAARLKQAAQPAGSDKEEDGPLLSSSSSSSSSSTTWISTYDAMCAFAWRHLTRARLPYYKPDPSSQAPWFGEAINMRPRITNPAPPRRMARNMAVGGFSDAPGPGGPSLPTIGDLAHDAPLAALAQYVRRLTSSVTQAHVEALLAWIATLRDKQSASFNLMSKPPMTLFVTDHRAADVSGCDFGFGRPVVHRFLTGGDVSANMTLVYPPAAAAAEEEEGLIWCISVEEDIVPTLLADKEFGKFFEYRGLD
ncbi:hypothetical protein M406DRAFT_342569 [Cryphonectria parasitica EP155]|uniref:Trichothecene 3-O-acetyltransferase-like N-terminal domain-containing protein n=1 Tax=Cryphonectria parasitica (strain ATCC 38755 / EP155) TaxID=660469 RepID=A0A9P4XVQ6_CRYP1|nr:uncharacterized protein M406DRAFT_342569 [Cryphonectria parasitica EP155]KAF3761878.1 hypothetical protein M406DRAFT_342569 [Cryphonectria parasitica EP155]